MKKLTSIFGAALMAAMILTSCGESYDEVTIGNQVWMQENLNVDKFRNGDPIPQAKTTEELAKAGKEGRPAWCYYKNNPENDEKYGKLYNWYAVNDPRGLAPEGWHVPTDEEWKILEMELGMSQTNADDTGWRGTNEGSKLAGNTGLWNDGDLENDSEFGNSGFTALPGGNRYNNGSFNYIGSNGYWWSATEDDTKFAWFRGVRYNSSNVGRSSTGEEVGFSVRCLRN